MIHQTQKKSKPCVARLTVVWETPYTAFPSNQKRVHTVKNLIFVVTQMIQCRKREEFHSAVKHLWGGGVRRSWCSTQPVRNLQAPFPTVFYIDLNQGWYWRHHHNRQIPSCLFHLDQTGSKRRKGRAFFVGFKFYRQTLAILLKTIPYHGRCKDSLSHPAGAELWGGWASAWRKVTTRAAVVAHVLPSAMAAWSQGRQRESFTCRLAITASWKMP